MAAKPKTHPVHHRATQPPPTSKVSPNMAPASLLDANITGGVASQATAGHCHHSEEVHVEQAQICSLMYAYRVNNTSAIVLKIYLHLLNLDMKNN